MGNQITSPNTLVAYVDILGFSSILEKEDPDVYYNAINKALAEWNKHFSKDITNKYELSRKFASSIFLEVFSDTFVIAVNEQRLIEDAELKVTPPVVFHVFAYLISYLIKDLFLETGHLLRGAIGRGQFYLNEFEALKGNNFIFSKALSDAYEAAEKIADTPRILIHENIFSEFKPEELCSSQPISTLIRDEDGILYLNVYGPMVLRLNLEIATFVKAKGIIEDAISKYKDDVIKRRKWIWFANYHNRIICRIIKHSNNIQLYPEYKEFKEKENLVTVRIP
ncbi:MAG: hypothetical protein PHS93_00635 [Candidatus Omnitrophica bacterium]|nr:hypothetical protein [Candidatus Omnitrophota bacterium]MDD5351658.1 hypothetical protein [Candidatus Omnitrophota bacterium]MDD5550868.1 hypothetical protein [Candidatus Omnitrophota bacterium]